MKWLFGLAAVAVVSFVLFVAFDPANQQMREDRAYYQREQQQLVLERERLELDERRNQSGVVTSVGAGFHVIVFAGVVALLAVSLDAYNQRRVPLVSPDKRGMLPVSRSSLERDELVQVVTAALAAYHRTQALQAEYTPQPVPHTVNYAPRFDGRAAAGLVSDVVASDAPSAAVVVPSFAELLSRGEVGQGRPLLLGYSEVGPLTGSWKDIYSSAVGGLPSSGKTTTVRFLAAQAALLGARFVVVDHHAEKPDGLANTLAPLASRFLCAPARDNASTLQALALVDELFEARKAGHNDGSIVLLCIDEFSALMRSPVGGEVADLVEKLNQEGRGFGMFGLYSGQVWLASRSGGSELRYSLASSFVHRMHRGMARLLLPEGEGSKVERLETGAALLWRPSGEVVQVKIPNTTGDDVVRLAGLLGKPDGSQMVAADNQATTASQSCVSPSSDAVRAASMFLAGAEPSEIVFKLRGVKSSEGRRYQTALAEVLQLVRDGLAGGAR